MEINKVYSGFRLDRIERIDEINGTAYEMKHEKSGARLIYIDSPDSNKLFNIALEQHLTTVLVWHILWSILFYVVLENSH